MDAVVNRDTQVRAVSCRIVLIDRGSHFVFRVENGSHRAQLRN